MKIIQISFFILKSNHSFVKIRDRIEENTIIHDDNFEFKRQSGINDSYISSLIHQDLVEEFIKCSTQTNMQLSAPIKQSTFETNYSLIKNQPNLIDYAIYYDSIQIAQYLLYNNVELTKSSWLYAIHSNSAQMIHLLEENHIEFNNEYYFEAIKCNHNNIARYLIDNHVNLDNMNLNSTKAFKNKIL
ncbi:hypothetical protein M9Y10_039079 [Tritrichomonas musculus]|uniref:DUF3447 domain-containing protein n=1 Tax=Tritrichomonas musculus TaxID=1915356 RepID=A0ABR2KAB7_9EUKA